MRLTAIAFALLLAVVACATAGCSSEGVSQEDFDALQAKVSDLEARAEIEDLIRSQVWAMDSGDMEGWLGLFSENIDYSAYNFGNETPLLPFAITKKSVLEMVAPMMIFQRSEHTFSTISNIQIDVSGDTATGRDYYVHYEYPIDPRTGEATEERAYVEGMHFYGFAKEDGEWKITKLRAVTYRKDDLLKQMEELMREALT
jgi:ketosteroid isomerase-like protein